MMLRPSLRQVIKHKPWHVLRPMLERVLGPKPGPPARLGPQSSHEGQQS